MSVPAEPFDLPVTYGTWMEAGVIGKLADNECRHGRLPGDKSPACGCWPHHELQAPDLMGVFHNATHPEDNVETTTPDAPYGYKADGVTPRKKPAPSPETMRAAAEGRRRAAAARTETPTRVATTEPAPQSPVIVRIVAQLDEEIAQLQAVREAVLAA